MVLISFHARCSRLHAAKAGGGISLTGEMPPVGGRERKSGPIVKGAKQF